MIVDDVRNYRLYEKLHGSLPKAFEFIRRCEAGALPEGRYEIDGSDVYALVQAYDTLPAEQKKWESHRKYIDVQYISQGCETMGWAPVGALRTMGEYLPEKDFCGYGDGPATYLRFGPGAFAIFYPGDAHKPGCVLDESSRVRKIVVKIKL